MDAAARRAAGPIRPVRSRIAPMNGTHPRTQTHPDLGVKLGARPKVVVVSANPSLKGGTNRAMVNVVSALAGEYDFKLLGLAGDESIYPLPPEVEIISLDGRRGAPLGRAAKTLLLATRIPRMIEILNRHRPDAVMSFLPRPNIVNVLVKRLSGLDYQCIVCERNFTSIQLADGVLNRLLRRVVKATYQRADLVVANAHALARDLELTYGVARKKIRTVYNSIDLEKVAALAEEAPPAGVLHFDAPVLLTVGRLIPQKNHDLLIRAFARARRTIRSRLAIIGEGPLLERSRGLAASLGVGDDVLFLGWQDNPFAFMKRSAAFVLSSNHEGFPNVLVEAMACACPVISTDCPSGPGEILENGKRGLLVPVHDEAALAAAMVRMLSDQPLRAELARRGYAGAQQFDLPAVLDAYRSVLSPPRSPPFSPPCN
jgi:glycosyltransferase involved in cell wall biosynthesis